MKRVYWLVVYSLVSVLCLAALSCKAKDVASTSTSTLNTHFTSTDSLFHAHEDSLRFSTTTTYHRDTLQLFWTLYDTCYLPTAFIFNSSETKTDLSAFSSDLASQLHYSGQKTDESHSYQEEIEPKKSKLGTYLLQFGLIVAVLALFVFFSYVSSLFIKVIPNES